MNDSKIPPPEPPSGGKPFGMVQADIFRDQTLPSAVKLVYVALVTYADAERTAFPSQHTLAHDTGLSLRSVKAAIKQGREAGLFEVVHTQSSNRYRLRDLRVAGYEVGSGPITPECRTCTLEMQEVHSGSAQDAHEQDHRTRPGSQTTTSSDAASGAPLASSRGDIKIMKPRGFDAWDDGRTWQYLTGAAIRIMKDSGLEPADDAASRIGQALRVTTERGESRERLLELLVGTIRLAGTDHETWGSLARRTSCAS